MIEQPLEIPKLKDILYNIELDLELWYEKYIKSLPHKPGRLVVEWYQIQTRLQSLRNSA